MIEHISHSSTSQTAVIKESLRMAPTTTSENSRLVPAKGAKIGEDFIPGNVSDSTILSSRRSEITNHLCLYY